MDFGYFFLGPLRATFCFCVEFGRISGPGSSGARKIAMVWVFPNWRRCPPWNSVVGKLTGTTQRGKTVFSTNAVGYQKRPELDPNWTSLVPVLGILRGRNHTMENKGSLDLIQTDWKNKLKNWDLKTLKIKQKKQVDARLQHFCSFQMGICPIIRTILPF